jgi:galactokinase
MHIAVAPGRVNLVGEHTDYNDGFVLPMAIDRYAAAAFGGRNDREVHVLASDFSDFRVIYVDHLDSAQEKDWSRYVAAVAWVLQEEGIDLSGANLVLRSDIPVGAGLSSSAAIELAVMHALLHLAGISMDAVRMALLARKAENEYVQVACGIMDQFVVSVAEDATALLLDCRSLEYERVRIPDEAVFFILDTGISRALADTVYGVRHRECQEALASIRALNGEAGSLRDVSGPMLDASRDSMPEILYRRASHVVNESMRPAAMAAAMLTGDLAEAGVIMNASHESLRDLYEVSCAELDLLVEIACANPACFGARLTGAGLGGCAVALVHRDGQDGFAEWVRDRYDGKFRYPTAVYACRPAAGAYVL